jgi:hypothetical protein
VDPRSNCVVSETSPGMLQFFDLEKGRSIYELNVIGQNMVFSSFGRDHTDNLKKISKLAFNRDGTWMATVSLVDDFKQFLQESFSSMSHVPSRISLPEEN